MTAHICSQGTWQVPVRWDANHHSRLAESGVPEDDDSTLRWFLGISLIWILRLGTLMPRSKDLRGYHLSDGVWSSIEINAQIVFQSFGRVKSLVYLLNSELWQECANNGRYITAITNSFHRDKGRNNENHNVDECRIIWQLQTKETRWMHSQQILGPPVSPILVALHGSS